MKNKLKLLLLTIIFVVLIKIITSLGQILWFPTINANNINVFINLGLIIFTLFGVLLIYINKTPKVLYNGNKLLWLLILILIIEFLILGEKIYG